MCKSNKNIASWIFLGINACRGKTRNSETKVSRGTYLWKDFNLFNNAFPFTFQRGKHKCWRIIKKLIAHFCLPQRHFLRVHHTRFSICTTNNAQNMRCEAQTFF